MDMARSESGAPKISVPRFNKSTDDRIAEAAPFPEDGVDVMLFEGWCVGAIPQPEEALQYPCNELEREHDANGIWRRYVNDALGGIYADVFSELDYLIMLKPPGFEAVYRWRGEQEEKLRRKSSAEGVRNSRVMDEAALTFFISHYERLTRWMLEEMPTRADEVFLIGDDHQVYSRIQNSPRLSTDPDGT